MYKTFYSGRVHPMNYGLASEQFRLCVLEIIASKAEGFILTPAGAVYAVDKAKKEPRVLFADEKAAAFKKFKA